MRATRASVARTIKSYMRTVVTDGTGGAGRRPGLKVAGKTGTAELRTTVKEEPPPEVTDPNAAAARGRHRPTPTPGSSRSRPTRKPKIAVAVMLVGQGTGGDTAAPAAGVVLKAALRLEVEVDDAAALRRRPASMFSFSGRFCSESVLSRKRISEPWIGPLVARCRAPGARCACRSGIGS